jgi:hypothetical protein
MLNCEVIKVKKIERKHAADIISLVKPFEIRNDGNSYNKGDILALCIQDDGIYTGEIIITKVMYKTDYAQQGDYVVLGLTYPLLTTGQLKGLLEAVTLKLAA